MFIRNCYSELVETLNSNPLTDELFQANCLNNEETLRIRSLGYKHVQNRELLNILMTKDDNVSLDVLVNYLQRNQQHLFSLLRDRNKEFQQLYLNVRRQDINGISSSPSFRIWFIQQNPLRNFIGRKEELSLLSKFYADYGNRDIPIIISGQEGIGKSSLVTSFINSTEIPKDVDVVWIKAMNQDKVQESLLQLVRILEKELKITIDIRLAPHELMQQIYKELGGHSKSKSIFIFDGVDDILMMKQFLPKGLEVSMLQPVIILTIRRHPILNSESRSIKLGGWSQGEAVEFIQSIAPESRTSDCILLARNLGYIPLALQQAMLYIREVLGETRQANKGDKTWIEIYLKKFKKNPRKLMADKRFRECLDLDYDDV